MTDGERDMQEACNSIERATTAINAKDAQIADLKKALGRIVQVSRINDGTGETIHNTKDRTQLKAIEILASTALGVK